MGVAPAWQVAFLVIARDPARFRPMMVPAMLEKVSFGAAAVVLFARGRLAGSVFAFALVDLLWCGLFAAAWWQTRPRPGLPP